MRRTETSIRSLRQQVQEQQRAAAQSEAAVQRLENDMLRLSRELASAEHETRQAFTPVSSGCFQGGKMVRR